MFKPEFNRPNGMNPNFVLVSRKNGIGYPYIQEFRDYHRLNPEVTSIEFLNKHTSKLCKFSIPQYFKDYFFPTPSKILPNEVSKSYQRCRELYSQICYCKSKFNLIDDVIDDVDAMARDLTNKYTMLTPIVCSCVDDEYEDWCIGSTFNDVNVKSYYINCIRKC